MMESIVKVKENKEPTLQESQNTLVSTPNKDESNLRKIIESLEKRIIEGKQRELTLYIRAWIKNV
jgi:low affinity Fe/Cu permease